MRRSFWLPFLLVPLVLLVPHITYAATTDFFGPIVAGECNCPGGAAAWGCVMGTLQALMNVAVSLGVVLITIFIAWAGVAYLSAPISAEGRDKAKQRLINAIFGLLIMLGAWLLVDSIMKVIYNSSNVQFGPWNTLLQANGAAICITPTSPAVGVAQLNAPNNATGGTPPVVGPSSSTGDCSAANLAQTWGSQKLGNTFSCIINDESRCQNILNKPDPNGDHSSAGGRYQVLVTNGYVNKPFVSSDSACVAIDHGINCDLYFHGGYSDGSANANLCDQALLDPTCNTQIAQSVYNLNNSGGHPWSAWTGSGDIGGKNAACIAKYASS